MTANIRRDPEHYSFQPKMFVKSDGTKLRGDEDVFGTIRQHLEAHSVWVVGRHGEYLWRVDGPKNETEYMTVIRGIMAKDVVASTLTLDETLCKTHVEALSREGPLCDLSQKYR